MTGARSPPLRSTRFAYLFVFARWRWSEGKCRPALSHVRVPMQNAIELFVHQMEHFSRTHHSTPPPILSLQVVVSCNSNSYSRCAAPIGAKIRKSNSMESLRRKWHNEDEWGFNDVRFYSLTTSRTMTTGRVNIVESTGPFFGLFISSFVCVQRVCAPNCALWSSSFQLVDDALRCIRSTANARVAGRRLITSRAPWNGLGFGQNTCLITVNGRWSLVDRKMLSFFRVLFSVVLVFALASMCFACHIPSFTCIRSSLWIHRRRRPLLLSIWIQMVLSTERRPRTKFVLFTWNVNTESVATAAASSPGIH